MCHISLTPSQLTDLAVVLNNHLLVRIKIQEVQKRQNLMALHFGELDGDASNGLNQLLSSSISFKFKKERVLPWLPITDCGLSSSWRFITHNDRSVLNILTLEHRREILSLSQQDPTSSAEELLNVLPSYCSTKQEPHPSSTP